MRLGLFMMPLHPLHRDPAATLQEDREAIILADRLRFHDAFVGEHLTDQAENVTNSFIFLASLIHATKTIKLTIPKRHIVFKTHEAQDDAELTDDYVVDRLVICGTVNKVVDEILKLREQAGDFGELVYAGMDWLDTKLALRSMELMATEVMPRVNKAIGGDS